METGTQERGNKMTRRALQDTVDLRDWDIILVNTSAGKDSQVMMHLLAVEARNLGISNRLHAVHAILEEEWEGTPEPAKAQSDLYGMPLSFVKRSQSLLEQTRARGMWPSAKQRYCTSDHKRDQVSKEVTRLAKEFTARMGRAPRILNCMGIRSQESSARSKKNPFQMDKRLTSKNREVWTYYPIFDMTLNEVWGIIKGSGLPYHRAYDLGLPRLSCCFCIFAPKNALLLAAKYNPELAERYAETEREINHKFRQDLSIAEVVEEAKTGAAVGSIADWNM